MPKYLSDPIKKDFIKRAQAERAAGGSIQIQYGLPYIAIENSNGDEYFFQEHEADALLADVPPNISDADYLLALSQIW